MGNLQVWNSVTGSATPVADERAALAAVQRAVADGQQATMLQLRQGDGSIIATGADLLRQAMIETRGEGWPPATAPVPHGALSGGGGYQVVRQLGQGGMATVYLAEQPSLEREVAIKVLNRRPSMAGDLFRREAATLAQTRHPNILSVHDYFENGDDAFIVMEYLRGGSLKDLADGRDLPLPYVVAIIRQIAVALDAAHAASIVHRDVKPANVLVAEAGDPNGGRLPWVLLADFGIALLRTNSGADSGGAIGTPAYMSPEQAQNQPIDRRSDVYALGIVAFELLTGALPFQASGSIEMAMQHILEPLPPVRSARRPIPKAMDAVIRKATAKQPADRYPTAGAFADALARALPSRRRPLLIAAMAAILALAIGGGSVAGVVLRNAPVVEVVAPEPPAVDLADVASIQDLLPRAAKAFAEAASQGGTTAGLEFYFADPHLTDLHNQVADLRRTGDYRVITLSEVRVASITASPNGPDEANAQTEERWDDRLYDRSGTLIRVYPARVAGTYTLVRTDQGWRVKTQVAAGF